MAHYSSSSFVPLDRFLIDYAPSKDLPVGWISVSTDVPEPALPRNNDGLEAVKRYSIVDNLFARCESVARDRTILVHAGKNRVTKANHREAIYEDTRQQLKSLAFEYGNISGKWLLWVGDEWCDHVWSTIVRSLFEPNGKLRQTKVFYAKIAASKDEDKKARIICVYIPNSWDKSEAGKVLRILVQDLGLVVNSFKADIYTDADIYSGNSCKFPPTIYTVDKFISKDELVGSKERNNEKGKPAYEGHAYPQQHAQRLGNGDDAAAEARDCASVKAASENRFMMVPRRSLQEEEKLIQQNGGFEDSDDDATEDEEDAHNPRRALDFDSDATVDENDVSTLSSTESKVKSATYTGNANKRSLCTTYDSDATEDEDDAPQSKRAKVVA